MRRISSIEHPLDGIYADLNESASIDSIGSSFGAMGVPASAVIVWFPIVVALLRKWLDPLACGGMRECPLVGNGEWIYGIAS